MKKRNLRLTVVTLMLTMCLSGCGASMYELTDEEEALIVHYSAHSLARYNIFQVDGLGSAVYEPTEEETELSTEVLETETESGSGNEGGGDEGGNTEEIPESADPITVDQALGCEGKLQISYEGYEVASHYTEGEHFAVDAGLGKKLVITKFTVENITEEPLVLDFLSQKITFKGCFYGQEKITAMPTFITYDLGTYVGTLEPAKKTGFVLLFEIPEEKADALEDVKLYLEKDSSLYPIKL